MIIDFTMPIDKRTPVYPGDPKQEINQLATIKENGWNEKRLTFNSHFSTHIDAPYHMVEKGKKLTDYPIERFIGEAIVLEMANPQLDKVKEGYIVFLHTGHTDKAYTEEFFKNTPVILESLAHSLCERKVKIVGLDSFSPDNAPFPVHHIFFKKDIPIVENLINLKQALNKRFMCYILPLKIQDADGAPCRVIGIF